MILYPPNITIVTPSATPPAIRNCGLASNPNITGEEAFSIPRMEGDMCVRRLESSARVKATAAMASGFACKVEIMAVAECCRHCASSSKESSFVIVDFSSSSACMRSVWPG